MNTDNNSQVVNLVQELVDKVKALEIEVAQTGRLREYNQVLRKANADQAHEINLIKKKKKEEPNSIPLIDITAEDDVVTKDPLEIPEVLQLVMKHMDERKQVLQSRLISKAWNDSALVVIKGYHPLTYRMISEEGRLITGTGATPLQLVPHLEEFTGLLRSSSSPYFMLNRLVIDGKTMALAKVQNFLKEFGFHVRSIVIESCTVPKIVIKRLLSIWCNNASDLEIEALQTISGIELDEAVTWTTSLNRLTVDTPTDGIYTIRHRNASHILTIVQRSPSLTYLKLHGNEEVSTSVWRQLKEYNKITSNFQEIWMTAGDGDRRVTTPLKIFLDVEVGSQLKALTLSFEEEFNKVDFISALHKLSPHLEKLTLLRTDFGDVDSNVSLGTGFPRLSKLKVLNFLATKWHSLKFKDVLGSLPNLEKLTLAGNFEEFCNMEEFKADDFLAVTTTSPRSHAKLKHLLIAGVLRDPVSTNNVSIRFPCLEKLYICVEIVPMRVYTNPMDIVNARDKTDTDEKLVEIFKGLAKVLNLKTLFINFGDFKWPANLNFEVAFEPLTTLNSLHTLMLINGDEGGFPTENFTDGIIYLLKNCKGLRFLELVNFKLRLPDASGLMSRIEPRSTKLVKFVDRLSTEDFVEWIINKF